MENIYATISGHRLALGNAAYTNSVVKLPSGGALIDKIIVTVTGDEWNNLTTRKAAFWRKDTKGAQYVPVTTGDSANSVTIPTSMLAEPGIVYVSFAGESGGGGSARTIRITTNAAAIVVEQGYKPE